MKCLLTAFLSTAAVRAALTATPAAAQVAGNPGDQHTPTPYTQDYWGHAQSIFGFGAFGTTAGAAASAPAQAAQPRPNCSATQDFNGRYTVACGP